MYFYEKFELNECLIKYLYGTLYQYLNTFEYSTSFHAQVRMSECIPTNKIAMNDCPKTSVSKQLLQTNG